MSVRILRLGQTSFALNKQACQVRNKSRGVNLINQIKIKTKSPTLSQSHFVNDDIKVSIIESNSDYLIINKASGIRSFGTFSSECLLPQLTSLAKRTNPAKPVDPTSFKIVQRLDRFVSGGMIICRTDKFAKIISESLKEKAGRLSVDFQRHYVGLLSIEGNLKEYIQNKLTYKLGHETNDFKGLQFENASLTKGTINCDIESLVRDDRNKSQKKKNNHSDRNINRKLKLSNASTRFKILHDLNVTPAKKDIALYPELLKGKTIVPILLELQTGRKNQIRDHVLQAFGTTLLNDDNFAQFKLLSNTEDRKPVNSEKYHNNQIGLHSIKLTVDEAEYIVPVMNQDDRWLWKWYINPNTGNFNEEIIHHLQLF